MVYMIDKIVNLNLYNFLSSIELSKSAMWITLPWTFFHSSEKGVSLWMMQTLFFYVTYVHEKAFIEVKLFILHYLRL